MGTQDRHPPTAPRSGRGPQQAWTDASPAPDRTSAEDALEEIQAVLGPAIMLEPGDLDDVKLIARELGLDHAVDHTRQGCQATVWLGTYRGVDVQVRAALRSTAGSAR